MLYRHVSLRVVISILRVASISMQTYASTLSALSNFFLFGGQGHPGMARGTQEKAMEGVPRAPWGPPGFLLGPPGTPWVPLASKTQRM